MAKLDLTFIHVDDSTEMDVELDDSITVGQVIQELVNNDFIPRPNDPRERYTLSIKGGNTLNDRMTLQQAGVHNSDQLRVLIAQRGGLQGDSYSG